MPSPSESGQTSLAQNKIAPGERVGERPYEMVWAKRSEERPPLVDFEDLGGWTVVIHAGARAEFARSREQQMWGQYVGKLVYHGTSKDSKILVSPPKPILIPGSFDCANLWCYGNNWGWKPDPTTPHVDLALHIQDADKHMFRIPLTNVRWEEWWLIHKRIDKSMLAEMKFPCSFVGLEILGGSNSEKRTIYFDSLAFYTEELKPLTFEPRPARNIDPFPGQSHGLNGTGKGKLPFPTRKETILPENFEKEYTNAVFNHNETVAVTGGRGPRSATAATDTYAKRMRFTTVEPNIVESAGQNGFVFRYHGKDAEISYVYVPKTGDMSEIAAFVNGQQVAQPLKDGGIKFSDDKGTGKLESAGLHDGVVTVIFGYGEGDERAHVEYQLRIIQKSLIIDVFCRGGQATELSIGEMSDVENPQLIVIPYLTFGGSSNPRVLMMGTPRESLFASVWIDWYQSNGSELYSQEWVKKSEAKINGGVRYHPKTDGSRNDLFERLFVTVSPAFEEVLPTIANPPNSWGREAGECLWQESWGPANYKEEKKRCKMLHSYGIEHFILCNHEIAWRDGGDSFTLRTKAAPKKGGDEALIKFVAEIKSLGFRCGLYTNYTDFAPVNEHWDEDGVIRTRENDWGTAWPRCYALKPSRAVEWEAKIAPLIKEKYDSNSGYTDVHTAISPWCYCDYDARVPGAGTFTATFYAYGELLLNDQKIYGGPIFSEGTFQWLYAGLTSGNYGLAYTDVKLSEEPLNVAFDLMKIHPLECDMGVPWTSAFFHKKGWDSPEEIDASIDRFIAATLAYGHIGWLVEEKHGIRRTCRSYYLIQQAAKRYAMQRPVKIEYADRENCWLTVSQALATGAIKDSRLHVIYENGLELFVNWSKDNNWEAPVRGCASLTSNPIIPPNGFLAFNHGGFLAGSLLVNGHRTDQVISPEYAYLDGRDSEVETEWLTASGAVAMKFKTDSKQAKTIQLEITDVSDNQRIGFQCNFAQPVCTAYDEEGHELEIVPLDQTDGKYWLQCVENARRYVVRSGRH